MTPQTAEERFDSDQVNPEDLKKMAQDFLATGWVSKMYMYVRTIKGLGLPPEPENQTDMKQKNKQGVQIMSVPALMTRAKANADRWEPMLSKMAEIAGGIQLYAETSVTTIEVLAEEKDKYAAMNEKKKQAFKRDFAKGLEHLQKMARTHKESAARMRDEVLAYGKDIENDHDMSKDIQDKYQGWLNEQEKQVKAWEEAHQVPHDETGDALMQKFETMVADYQTKWAGLASGAGAATMGMVILPPFGTIAAFFAMTSLAVAAEEMHKLMAQFKGFLDRVQRFNGVKLFFKILDKDFENMRKVCAAAVKALGEVAGAWEKIELRLGNLTSKVNQIDPLKVTTPEEWEEPISLIAKKGAERVYNDLIEKCEEFTRYLYVKDITEQKVMARENAIPETVH